LAGVYFWQAFKIVKLENEILKEKAQNAKLSRELLSSKSKAHLEKQL